VVTNPTSAHEKLDVLIQIPRGAIPVSEGLATRTIHADVQPYGTWSMEHAFYFPAAGRFSHFPAHVTRAGKLLAWANPAVLTVAGEPSTLDPTSWVHLSQHGTLDEVLTFLERENLGRIDIERIAFRMRDRAAFERTTSVLAARLMYHDVLWAYALLHRDRRRMAEWLRHQEAMVLGAGTIDPDDAGDTTFDATVRGEYQHIEVAPLVNARAHRLGGRSRIVNDGLDRQYRAFLEMVAHRKRPTGDDLLAAVHYLFTMDRVDDAQKMLARVDRARISTHLQYDYLAAYAATLDGDKKRARSLAEPWISHPVDRWRKRFAALLSMLDEAEGRGPAALVDADSRDQRVADLAARQPSFTLAVDGKNVLIDHQNLPSLELRFYRMDIELLFSRQPFVQGDTGRFSFIEPNHTEEVTLEGARTVFPVPPSLRGENLVIEAVSAGARQALAHYAHDLSLQVSHQYGQVRILRASTRAPLSATYVKVYARNHGGAVQFYKDGYTDLRGRFDYATLSTDDLDRVRRFAILVVSEEAGAAVTEADPPQR
jgi:hypothetical protein